MPSMDSLIKQLKEKIKAQNKQLAAKADLVDGKVPQSQLSESSPGADAEIIIDDVEE